MSLALSVLVGLVALTWGAGLVIRGGSALAADLRVPPIVIGVTVVSIGTSVPELAVGIDAGLRGDPDLTVGNIAGTNMVNLLLILGLSAAMRPLALVTQTLRFDLPAMVVAAAALLLLTLDGHLSALDGAVMIVGGLTYLVWVVRAARRETAAVAEEYAEEFGTPPGPRRVGTVLRQTATLVAGIVVVLLGAEVLVDGAVDVARELSVPEAVIGLTVIGIGTSAPELATTIVSTVRGERDIAIGNLLGSSVLNVLLILGISVTSVSGGIPVSRELATIDLPLMLAVAVLCIPVFRSGRRLSRGEGALFVLLYLAYLTYLVTLRA